MCDVVKSCALVSQEDALPRAGTLRGGGQVEALLLLRHLWQELRQQGESEAAQAACAREVQRGGALRRLWNLIQDKRALETAPREGT